MKNLKQNFASDNTAAVIPEAWQALEQANTGFVPAYGDDDYSDRAKQLIADLFDRECEVFFLLSGTAANALSLASMCQPHHKVICHHEAHINTAECGAPGFLTHGTGLHTVGGELGKLDPDEVRDALQQPVRIYYQKAAAISVTQPTEYGVTYSVDELAGIADIARAHDLSLHMDGARFFNAVATLETTPAAISCDIGVDVLSFGATKLGLPAGEAVVFFNPALAAEFGHRCKQSGHVASKARYLSAPWIGLLQDGAWQRHAQHANNSARQLARQLEALDGLQLLVPVECNFILIDMPAAVHGQMREKGWFYYIVMGDTGARLLCSWQTTGEDITAFVNDVKDCLAV